MAYEYKKLSEVEAIDVADSSVNLIVETEDEIKKLNIGDLPIGQEQADWDEKDETKASFIKNKPDLSQVGGSGGKITIIDLNDSYPSIPNLNNVIFEDTGEIVTLQKIYEALLKGVVMLKTESYPSETWPWEQYYPVIRFCHYNANTYINSSGLEVTHPEKLEVSIIYGDKPLTLTFQ